MNAAGQLPTESAIPPLPDWASRELIDQTRGLYAQKYGRELTVAEAAEILLAFGRLLDALED